MMPNELTTASVNLYTKVKPDPLPFSGPTVATVAELLDVLHNRAGEAGWAREVQAAGLKAAAVQRAEVESCAVVEEARARHKEMADRLKAVADAHAAAVARRDQLEGAVKVAVLAADPRLDELESELAQAKADAAKLEARQKPLAHACSDLAMVAARAEKTAAQNAARAAWCGAMGELDATRQSLKAMVADFLERFEAAVSVEVEQAALAAVYGTLGGGRAIPRRT